MSTKKFILSTPVDPIRAILSSDDNQYNVNFDATEWFNQASHQEIHNLAKCEWMRDYPADAVAQYFDRPQNPAVRKAFKHIRGERCGFEVAVNDRDALAWLERNRPNIFGTMPGVTWRNVYGDPMADEWDWQDWEQTK